MPPRTITVSADEPPQTRAGANPALASVTPTAPLIPIHSRRDSPFRTLSVTHNSWPAVIGSAWIVYVTVTRRSTSAQRIGFVRLRFSAAEVDDCAVSFGSVPASSEAHAQGSASRAGARQLAILRLTRPSAWSSGYL